MPLRYEFVQEAGGQDAWGPARLAGPGRDLPCTMVDRIVPATEDRHRELSVRFTGRSDDAPVPAEPFSMWVLEDLFPAGGRPEAGGAVFTDRVRDYELLKLRLCNASHSLLAYLGLLSGEATIADALGPPPIRRIVEQLMRPEMLSTFVVPKASAPTSMPRNCSPARQRCHRSPDRSGGLGRTFRHPTATVLPHGCGPRPPGRGPGGAGPSGTGHRTTSRAVIG